MSSGPTQIWTTFRGLHINFPDVVHSARPQRSLRVWDTVVITLRGQVAVHLVNLVLYLNILSFPVGSEPLGESYQQSPEDGEQSTRQSSLSIIHSMHVLVGAHVFSKSQNHCTILLPTFAPLASCSSLQDCSCWAVCWTALKVANFPRYNNVKKPIYIMLQHIYA